MDDVAAVPGTVGTKQPREGERVALSPAMSDTRAAQPLVPDCHKRDDANGDGQERKGLPQSEDDESGGHDGRARKRDPEYGENVPHVGPSPWQQRAYSHEENEREEDRAVYLVEERLADRDNLIGSRLGKDGVDGAPEGDERDG